MGAMVFEKPCEVQVRGDNGVNGLTHKLRDDLSCSQIYSQLDNAALKQTCRSAVTSLQRTDKAWRAKLKDHKRVWRTISSR